MQKHDRDGLHIYLGETLRQVVCLKLVERSMYFAASPNPFVDLEDQLSRHERTVLLELQVEGVGTVDPTNLVDIAEPARRHDGRPRALAFDQRVDNDSAAVHDRVRHPQICACVLDASEDPVDEVRRSA